MTAREQQLLNFLNVAQQKEVSAMCAAFEAGDAVAHGRHRAAFDALATVWEKLNELVCADSGVSL